LSGLAATSAASGTSGGSGGSGGSAIITIIIVITTGIIRLFGATKNYMAFAGRTHFVIRAGLCMHIWALRFSSPDS
jgi:hypothetical protein